MRLNSYTGAIASLTLFATAYVAFGFINTPDAAPAVPPSGSHATITPISVGPDCNIPVKPQGVETSAATGVCTLVIDRQRHPFIAVRTERIDTYDRTSPENTTDKLVVHIRGGQLNAWLDSLPSPAFSTWTCGFDVTTGSVSDDTCHDQPLEAAVN